MVEIINKKLTFVINTRTDRDKFNFSKVVIPKNGSHVEIDNGHIDIHIANGRKIDIGRKKVTLVKDDFTGETFKNPVALFDRLGEILDDREGKTFTPTAIQQISNSLGIKKIK